MPTLTTPPGGSSWWLPPARVRDRDERRPEKLGGLASFLVTPKGRSDRPGVGVTACAYRPVEAEFLDRALRSPARRAP